METVREQYGDEIEARYEKAKRHVDHLTQSILAKAFRGELVPQDPNDEPASELLKRIQAERAEAKDKGPKYRKAGMPERKMKKAVRETDKNGKADPSKPTRGKGTDP
jgi:hypothetical protein